MSLEQIPTPVLLAELARRCGDYQIRVTEKAAARVVSWAAPVLDACAAEAGIEVEELLDASTRHAAGATIRHLAMFCLKQVTGRSFDEIGSVWGQSYSNAIHGHQKTVARTETDPAFAARVRRLVGICQSQAALHARRRSARQARRAERGAAAQ